MAVGLSGDAQIVATNQNTRPMLVNTWKVDMFNWPGLFVTTAVQCVLIGRLCAIMSQKWKQARQRVWQNYHWKVALNLVLAHCFFLELESYIVSKMSKLTSNRKADLLRLGGGVTGQEGLKLVFWTKITPFYWRRFVCCCQPTPLPKTAKSIICWELERGPDIGGGRFWLWKAWQKVFKWEEVETARVQMWAEHRCSVCGDRLASASSLAVHMRNHIGDKLFACDLCDQSFAFLAYMQQHKQFHRPTKDFGCNICGKKYQTMNFFIVTIKSHINDYGWSSNVKTFTLNFYIIICCLDCQRQYNFIRT